MAKVVYGQYEPKNKNISVAMYKAPRAGKLKIKAGWDLKKSASYTTGDNHTVGEQLAEWILPGESPPKREAYAQANIYGFINDQLEWRKEDEKFDNFQPRWETERDLAAGEEIVVAVKRWNNKADPVRNPAVANDEHGFYLHMTFDNDN